MLTFRISFLLSQSSSLSLRNRMFMQVSNWLFFLVILIIPCCCTTSFVPTLVQPLSKVEIKSNRRQHQQRIQYYDDKIRIRLSYINIIDKVYPFIQQYKRYSPFLYQSTSSSSSSQITETTETTVRSSSIFSESNNNENNNRKMKFVSSVRDVVNEYDIFLVDMWGVMHDGSTPYEGVIETIHQLHLAGKKLIILSNSSKRLQDSISMLQKLGFDPTMFYQILTSGEISYQMLVKAIQNQNFNNKNETDVNAPTSSTTPTTSVTNLIDGNWYQEWNGFTKKIPKTTTTTTNSVETLHRVFVFGSGDYDVEYCTDAGWTVSTIDTAHLILARGTFTVLRNPISISGESNDESEDEKQKTIDHSFMIQKDHDPLLYETKVMEALQYAAKQRIPMLISNPDKIRPDKDRCPMPGTLGVAYIQALRDDGEMDPESYVKHIGKPFDDIYTVALQNVSSTSMDDGSSSSSSSNNNISVDLTRVCMVGDALETDVVGGTKFGIPTIWVLQDGVYQNEFQNCTTIESIEITANRIVTEFNELDGTYAKGSDHNNNKNVVVAPTYIMPYFRW